MNTTIDLQKIEADSTALVAKAKAYEIITNEIYVEAMEFAKEIKASIKKVEEAFDPIIKSAHTTWKGAIAQKDKYLEPREKALTFLDGKARAFRTEQERVRLAEQRRLQDLADKESERLRKLAEKAESRGDTVKTKIFTAKAEQAAMVAPVVASKVAKVEGLSIRKVWKYRVTNIDLVPKEYWIPAMLNDVLLGNIARSKKDTIQIPGIEIYSEDSKL